METVWIEILLWRFYVRFSLEIVWGFHGKTWRIKLRDNLDINFTIKSPLKV